jgi:hypothetical protein
MAANTVTTFDFTTINDDLRQVIYNISPDETPFLMGIGVAKASNTLHEWQYDELTAVNTSNAVIQGDDATIDASTNPTRLGNYTQLMDKTAEVSSTAKSVDVAGMGDPMDYQLGKKSKEFKRDIEGILLMNQARSVGTAASAALMGTMGSWVGTNDSIGTGSAASPVGANGTAARTDGTQKVFVEADFNSVMQAAWEQGGEPSVLMVGAFNKRRVSTSFSGIASSIRQASEKTVISAIDTLDTDFGTVRVIPNRIQRARDAWVLDFGLLEIAYLQPMQRKPLPSNGHYERELLWCEATLVVKNEKGLGGIFDLTTS